MELDAHVRGQVVVEGARQWPTARQFGMSREKVKKMWSRAAAGLPAIGASRTNEAGDIPRMPMSAHTVLGMGYARF